jgi:16S rRNA processing protein RimM
LSSSTDPIARLGRPHGLEGYLGLYVDPDDLALFAEGTTVLVGDLGLTIRAIRPGKKGPQIAFNEITDRVGADQIRNRDLRLPDVARGLGSADYWVTDLIGLEVRPGGGVVIGVDRGPAQDRLLIDRDGSTFEVPFVRAMVPVVDIDGGFVVIEEIEGLEGVNPPSG